LPTHTELANFIWSVADLLRGDYKQSEYGKVILPFTVLRRLDCVMTPTRERVWAADKKYDVEDKDTLLCKAAGLRFYNLSDQDFRSIKADPQYVLKNLTDYLNWFSPSAREILEKYDFHVQIARLDAAGLLYKVVAKFAEVDLSPAEVDNHQMGYVFEELIRKFSEISNETAGEHFTPREVIELMVNILLAPDAERLTDPAKVINVLDPACGTGGMLSAAEEHIKRQNPQARVYLFGQELNAESYAICRSDMMIKDQDPSRIVFGNSFSNDGHSGKTFDYLLANPPFGVEWKKVQKEVEDEHKSLGYAGRFGAGLPRINDGSFLFLQHMLAKMQPVNQDGTGGSRVAIVFNGSPLFTGAAGSGESEIRRWILEHDLLEGIVGLPDQLFYNTGISTYFWILTNRKDEAHKGKVILLDVRDHWAKMRKSLGDKRKYITDDQIRHITRLYGEALSIAADPEHERHSKVKVFNNEDFGYQRITVDRPLKLRFEVTDDALAVLSASEIPGAEQLVDALKPLLGTTWGTRAEAKERLHSVIAIAGHLSATVLEKTLWAAISIADPDGEVQVKKGMPEPDPDLRDYENVPLAEDIDEYFAREVVPHVPDAWVAGIKDSKTKETVRAKIGYEIPFTRYFYVYAPPRPLAEIDAELKLLEARIQTLLGEVIG